MAMATANPVSPRSRGRRRTRLWLLVPVLVLGAAGAVALGPLKEQALAGAAFGARIACSCRHIEGRPLGECRKDFEPGMQLVMLSEDADRASVTAHVPLLASQTATFRPGQGCALEPWKD